MFRLTAEFGDDRFVLTLSHNGAEIFTTTDPVEAAEWMLNLSIDDPLPLIEGARQWGVVEIHEATTK